MSADKVWLVVAISTETAGSIWVRGVIRGAFVEGDEEARKRALAEAKELASREDRRVVYAVMPAFERSYG